MGKNQEKSPSANEQYAEKYAVLAMEQMKRYGIPASVILAQGILESSNGKSELSQLGNNHFGIKASTGWLKNGGEYLVYTDDRLNEKFCKYDSVKESYEHHSTFLKSNSRYSKCFAFAADDYKNWSKGLEKAGYATGDGYTARLEHIIERNGLQKYDQMVMQEMKAQGKEFGVGRNGAEVLASSTQATFSQQNGVKDADELYSFPVKRNEFLFITSPFGMRQDPMDDTKRQMHKSIDIQTNHDDVLATENKGKVVDVNHNPNTAGGKSVTVEYSRADNTRIQISYMHLSEIAIKPGDSVQAGEKLGVTGNTGTRTTGEHLHFSVKSISAEGKSRDIDPAAYLAEIGQKGNIPLQALHNGNDLLAKYKSGNTPDMPTKMSSEEWIKKLLSSEDSSVGLDDNDPIMGMITALYSSLLMLAVQIDHQSEEEKKAVISESVSNRRVDLKPLMPAMKECSLTMGENGKATLTADNGMTKVSRELTSAEISRLSMVLNNPELSREAKEMRVTGMVNSVVLSQQASQNYEQKMAEQEGQAQNMQRK